jgi:glycosyltransferase involved in cell wall biosynthesis
MAVLGHSAYLEDAIASIERQTYPAWRLHLSQDGAHEPSIEQLVARRADSRITYSATGQRIGAPANKWRLIRSGTAPYVALLDHDDLWRVEFLQRRVEFLDEHPECAFVFSPQLVIDRAGRTVRRASPQLADGVYTTEEIVPVLLRADGIAGASIVVRRSAYEAVHEPFRNALPRTYDYEMWVRLALSGAVGYLCAWDAGWRLHGSNASVGDSHGYHWEYERLVTLLEVDIAQARPDLLPTRREMRRKLAQLLLMSAVDAAAAGDRMVASGYLARAVLADPRGGWAPATYAAALPVVFGAAGASLVSRARRLRHRERVSGARATRTPPTSGIRWRA